MNIEHVSRLEKKLQEDLKTVNNLYYF